IGKRIEAVSLEDGRAVRELRAGKRPRTTTKGANVTKIEGLIDDSGSAGLQVLLHPLRGQNQTSFFQSRHRLVVLHRSFLQPELLGEEEKGLVFLGVENAWDVQRTADRTPEILPPI